VENTRKKEILREYKERKTQPGIFAVRCAPSGKVWVSSATDLSKHPNGLWFQLRLGGFPNRDLQAAWSQHGEVAFTYELLEEITDDNALIIGELLKEREAEWRKELAAEKLVG
jgi:hypothetical protein